MAGTQPVLVLVVVLVLARGGFDYECENDDEDDAERRNSMTRSETLGQRTGRVMRPQSH